MYLKHLLKINPSIKYFLIKIKSSIVFIVFRGSLGNINCVKVPAFIGLYKTNDSNLVLYSNLDVRSYLNFITRRLSSLHFPYFIKLILKGLGFRMKAQNEHLKRPYLELKLGFSHLNRVNLPPKVSIFIKKYSIIVSGFNRSTIGNLARQIYNLRRPNVYTSKGFRYRKQILYLKNIKKT